MRNAAIVLEHTDAEWEQITSKAHTEGRKPQPRRLSTYNRAVNIARSLAGQTTEQIADRVNDYLSTSPDSPSTNNFMQWLLNRPQQQTSRTAKDMTWEERRGLIRALLSGSGDPRKMWLEVEP